MTIIVNLYRGPGTGKSTNAARLFSMLKDEGVEVELVTEYAKDLVWEDNLATLDNQLFVFANQHHKLYRLLDKVDVVITDSPLLLSVLYGRMNKDWTEEFEDFVQSVYSGFNNLDVMLERVKPYKSNGRLQTEEEARELDNYINLLIDADMFVKGNKKGCKKIFKAVMKLLKSEHRDR